MHQPFQRAGLVCQRRHGGGGFLDHGGILLGGAINLADCGIDLRQTEGLFAGAATMRSISWLMVLTSWAMVWSASPA